MNINIMRNLSNINTNRNVVLNILKIVVVVIVVQFQIKIVDCTQCFLFKCLRYFILFAINVRTYSFVYANDNITILTINDEITQRKNVLSFKQIIKSIKKSHFVVFVEKKMILTRKLHAVIKKTHKKRYENEITHQQLIYYWKKKRIMNR